MAALAHIAAGDALVLAGWLIPRRVAAAPIVKGTASIVRDAALALDAAPAVAAALVLVLATGRPLFAGLVVLALGIGFAFVDRTMRETLREPVVFSEMSEVPHIFTHPHLYLPFAGTGLVLGGAAATIGLPTALLVLEPAVSVPRPLAALLTAALLAGVWWLIGRPPLLGRAAALLRRLGPTGEPFADATALGPFAMLLVHGVIARAERAGRQAAAAPAHAPSSRAPSSRTPSSRTGRTRPGAARPMILVQCESFVDARRLAPVPADFLPGFESCCRTGALFGRLAVPGWGANTMRSEFAVLSGLPETALGYDRFNPYHAFARVPIASQVWRLRAAGYRTICLHPFDRTFFRRDRAMPALGFERFLGREALGGSRRPPYCPDPELADQILRVLDTEGPSTLIFAITMGNHGPWFNTGHPPDAALADRIDAAHIAQGDELVCYLDGVRRSDEMLSLLMAGLTRRGSDAVLGFYGDHQPSLPRAFAQLGFAESSSDYAIWPAGLWGAGEPARRLDLPADRLGRVIVDAVLGEVVGPPD